MNAYQYKKRNTSVAKISILPLSFIILGLSLLAWVSLPILSFQLNSQSKIISPLADDIIKPVSAQTDLTKANNWFGRNAAQKILSPISIYTISIPKIKIAHAYVKIGTDDLSKSLIQYNDSSFPGNPGNTVIFGHSVLPQFFDPNNYLTIFSLLPDLAIDDEIFINFDQMSYRYIVTKKIITEPEDISGLEQKYDDSYLTLVTCVPPGTYFKRLWLTARLVKFDSKLGSSD